MKNKNQILLLSSILLFASLWTKAENVLGGAEKRKTFSKTYPVTAKDRLSLKNKFGEVNINLWDKNEIKVDVMMVGYGKDDEQAQKYLESITIVDSRSASLVAFSTEIAEEKNSWWGGGNGWSWHSGEDNRIRKGVEINYVVFMPKNIALNLNNSYGKTQIGDFSADLSVSSSYGSLVTNNLTGATKDIKVAYGKASIQGLEQGTLKISYSSLELSKGGNISLKNSHGSVNLGTIENLDADLSYSTAKIAKLEQVAKLELDYGGIDIREVGRTAKSIDIKANYSSVKLPDGDDNNYDFDVSTHYGAFSASQSRTSYTQNTDQENDKGFKSTKLYKGHIGRGTGGTKVVIRANYGGVKFVER